MFSLFVGGGQDYHGPTAERDQKVAGFLGRMLRDCDQSIQIITGGMAGIPEEISRIFSCGHNKVVLDVVPHEMLLRYLERTVLLPRPHWVYGTNAERRVALASNTNIKVALFIQGGQYTTHEIILFQQLNPKCRLVIFTGSGGASGGKIPYMGDVFVPPKRETTSAYDSEDPDADPHIIAQALFDAIFE